MTYQAEREAFLLQMQAEGMAPEIARRILRHANTIQRLSAAECNGDYPCDNGERKVEWCARCEAGYVRAAMFTLPRTDPAVRICQSCHTQDLIVGWCAKAGDVSYMTGAERGFVTIAGRFVPLFQGDPRGACVKLKVPSGKTDDHAREGICVPTRRY